jgi:GTP-binding protein
VDPKLSTLVHLDNLRLYRAKNGEKGGGSNCHGARGRDLVLSVPPGTLVFDEEHGERLEDLVRPGQRLCAAKGGRGGRGNARFATPVMRAPRKAEPGGEGEERELRLELKLLADVGLVGFPNAGKSTLLARVSKARPKIADYPFTTLTPHLGVVAFDEEFSFVAADIPGLIEGAHRGAGLGHEFLRHIERTAVLIHLVDMSDTGRKPLDDVRKIEKELKAFDAALARKPQILAANKLDTLPVAARGRALAPIKRFARKEAMPFFAISAVTGEGVPELLAGTAEFVRRSRESRMEAEAAAS